jgi:hypothetical protein
MRIDPDILIQRITLADYRIWVRHFARYGEDEDIAFFKGRLEQAKKDTAFLGSGVRLVRRLDTMSNELEKALAKERRSR